MSHCCLPLVAAVRLSQSGACELRRAAAAWAGSLCTSPSEQGLEVHVPPLSFQAVLEGNGGTCSAAKERALKEPCFAPPKPFWAAQSKAQDQHVHVVLL